MTRRSSILLLSVLLLSLLSSCNAPSSEEPVRGQAEVTPAKPTPEPEQLDEIIILELCSLLSEQDVETVIGVPVTASDEMGIANCTYTSSDSAKPYSVSVSSAQGIEAKELNLVGVQILLAFASDEAALETVNGLVENAEILSVAEVVEGVVQFQQNLGAEVFSVPELGEGAQWIWNTMGSYGTLMWVEGETYLSFNMMGMEPSEAREYAVALAPEAYERLPLSFTVSTTGEFGGGFTFEYSSDDEPDVEPASVPEPSGPPAVWVTTSYGETVAHIDPATNLLASAIPLGKNLADIVAGSDYIIIANSDRSSLIWLDPITELVVQEIPIERGTHLKLALDAEHLYIGAPRWGEVQVRHRTTGDLETQMTYANCWDIEVSPSGFWTITGPEQETVVDIERDTWVEVHRFEPGGAVSYIKFYEGYYWLGVRDELHKVLKVDPDTYEVVGELTIDAGEQYMSAMGVGEDGVWVGFSQGTLIKVDPVSVVEVLRKDGLENPVGIAGGYGALWVSYVSDDMVARLDPETLSTIAAISVDQAPYAIALNP